MERIKQLTSHLTKSTPTGLAALQVQSPDDVVITMAVRTPLTKQYKGAFKDTPPAELLTALFKSSIQASHIAPHLIQDICVGNVLLPGAGYVARAAALAAGIPESTPVQVVNRFCSSGLMALSTISNQIRAGEIEVGLAVGFEAMSSTPDNGAPAMGDEIMGCQAANDATRPMGWTSENVAGDFHITRAKMDEYAAMSQNRASNAQNAGRFEQEIIPIEINSKNPETGAVSRIIVNKDDVIRHGTEYNTLLKIRSAFPQWPPSQTTGGNASQNSDGGSAVLLMTRRKANELGLKILAKHVRTSVVGVPPRIMGVGPAVAIPAVLKGAGLSIPDVDLFEINEAFASMYVYCIDTLGLDVEKVNVNGGAIALGHPLGATGARQVATGLAELARRNGKVLVTSMCIGTGQGAAAIFIRD